MFFIHINFLAIYLASHLSIIILDYDKIQIKSNFAFNKILDQAQKFSSNRMRSMLQNLLKLEIGIKIGDKSEKEILKQLVHIL